MSHEQLRIVVVGAGIAGLAATIALQRYDFVDVQLYERASRLHEIGASIALGPNGLRTLEKLGVVEALDDKVGFRNRSGIPMIYRHWKTNEIVSVDEHIEHVDPRHRTARFYRVHLQEALASHVDQSRIHLGKCFASVDYSTQSDSLVVRFTDGSTAKADVLLGTDGIHSAIRQQFLPGSKPKWTGWTAFRAVFEADRVRDIPEVLDDALHWHGPNGHFFSSRLGSDLFTIVGGYGSNPESPDAPYKDATWNSEGDVEVFQSYYKDWHPSIQQMAAATPYIRQYPNAFAPSIDSWVQGNGQVTFAGDAAHAHGGSFAAGGSLAIDDGYAFALAIRHVLQDGTSDRSAATITTALRLYEATRKVHADRVVVAAQQGNQKMIERLDKDETDAELRARMTHRADLSWIHEHDVEAAFSSAIRKPSTDDQLQIQSRI